MMDFIGSFAGVLDKKNRVSVPSGHRAVLPEGETFILRPSHRAACIQGYTKAGFGDFARAMQRMEMFSEDEEALAYALYADAHYCAPDKEGRCVLPESLVKFAGLADSVLFVGLRNRFEIWEPTRYQAHREEQLARARQKAGGLLPVSA